VIVQAEISLYPLKSESLDEPVKSFVAQLSQAPLDVETGRMSTVISGELKETFDALAESFTQVAEQYAVVLVIKLSNACPRGKESDL
jgi:uncharacterized protein YqgV (UPF0045/DUF77 family)